MYSIRLIQINDNPHIAHIIRQVSEEYGLAASSGFAVGDSILDELFEVYQQENAAYWVVEDQEGILLVVVALHLSKVLQMYLRFKRCIFYHKLDAKA